jgi:hypothetical protein
MHYDDELFDEEKEISIDELVEALSGEDEDGDPKSVVECSLYKLRPLRMEPWKKSTR